MLTDNKNSKSSSRNVSFKMTERNILDDSLLPMVARQSKLVDTNLKNLSMMCGKDVACTKSPRDRETLRKKIIEELDEAKTNQHPSTYTKTLFPLHTHTHVCNRFHYNVQFILKFRTQSTVAIVML